MDFFEMGIIPDPTFSNDNGLRLGQKMGR